MKLLRSFAFRLAALVLAAATPLAAQSTYTAKKIVFNDLGPYTQAELETAAGIHPGTTFKATDLGADAQRLVDTGLFGDVTASLAGQVSAATVLFDVKLLPPAQLLHVGFKNFVWLTHAEAEQAVQAKFPLFRDYLPENSPQQDVFSAALKEALSAKGIPATIAYETVEPTMLRPERTIEFRIATPSVTVGDIKLGGIDKELAPLIQKSVNATVRTAYNEGLAGKSSTDSILEPLLDAGYIKAALYDLTRTAALADGKAPVTLSATLVPGDIYHVSGLSFTGTPLLSAEAFASTQKLHAGDLASRAVLFETLAPLDLAYRRQGYMDVVVKSLPTADAATHEVAYNIIVVPGEQYRIREVTSDNLDPAARQAFDTGFKMKSGELYDPTYVGTFLKANAAQPAFRGYASNWKAYADPNTHTVDLVLTFQRTSQSR